MPANEEECSMKIRSRMYEVLIDPRVRILLSLAMGALIYFAFPQRVRFEIRLLLAWDIGVMVLLFLICIMMYRSNAAETLKRSQEQEPSHIATLLATLVISVATLVAMAFMINDGQNWKAVSANVHLGLCTLAIFSAWFLLHTFFAIHYARLYYDEPDEGGEGPYKKGLEFPGDGRVDYWDFMYYSFTIGMCYQTSDISVISTTMRRLTLFQSIVGFIFVATIIGLVVNVVSNLV
jgi:uncharacterized membrane protein